MSHVGIVCVIALQARKCRGFQQAKPVQKTPIYHLSSQATLALIYHTAQKRLQFELKKSSWFHQDLNFCM